MYEGKITGFRDPDVPAAELGRLMAGGADGGHALAVGPLPETARRPAAGHRDASADSEAAAGSQPTSGRRPDSTPPRRRSHDHPAARDRARRRRRRRRRRARRGTNEPETAATARSVNISATPSRTTPSRSRCSRWSPPPCIGGLLTAFTNTTVLHAWSDFFSAPGNAIAQAWDVASGTYVALFEGSVFNPHTVAALFQQASISTADPRRLPVRRVQPAVGDRGPGDAADPGRPRGGAAVPGRPVQHRRAEPVHRRRDHGRVARLRRQPAVLRARGRLRASAGSSAARRSAGWPARSRRAPGRTR